MIDGGFQPRFAGGLAARVHRRATAVLHKARDLRRGSYLPPAPTPAGARYFRLPNAPRFGEGETVLRDLCENYLAHRFDILGSGWTEVRHGMAAPGLGGHRYETAPGASVENINRSNRRAAAAIRALIDDASYQPVDWQRDVKSGYRWREDIWYRDIRYRGLPGADVKVPWELARLHHLPQLALAYTLAQAARPGFRSAEAYAREFRHQALDFIAANPPRFGVNWCCTMDVAIRAANLLVAHDLFRAADLKFDEPFEAVFWRSILEHGRHIAANLERVGEVRNNHYLANIAGLLFVAAYLPAGRESDSWLAFAARELFAEADYQFHADGTNFESSTAYHRLGAEMLLYGAALLLALGPVRGLGPLPADLGTKLRGMANFSADITAPSGRIVQIGDTDSGRFLKLFPSLEPGLEDALAETHLDHRPLIAGLSEVTGESGRLRDFAGADHPERAVVSALTGGRTLPAGEQQRSGEIGDENALAGILHKWQSAADANKQMAHFPLGAAFRRQELRLAAHADFGLYIFRAPSLFLAVRCGGEHAAHPRGHAHNDQLTVEAWIDGACRIADPGSFVYTPLPEMRNAYRSVRAHFAPQVDGGEPASLAQGLFALGPTSGAECLYFGARGFVGQHRAYGAPVWRAIAIGDEAIDIYDLAEAPDLVLRANDDILAGQPPYSRGYGIN
jgi:hypothetical protein